MKSSFYLFLLWILLYLLCISNPLAAFASNIEIQIPDNDPARQVNIFVGTTDGGNTTPAAHAPFGMVSFGPTSVFDETDIYNSRSGYDNAKGAIANFSLTHVSGWGCHGALDIPFMPFTGQIDRNPIHYPNDYASQFSHENESAEPGYYQVLLDGIDTHIEGAVSERSAVVSINYPEGDSQQLLFMPPNCANGTTASNISINTSKNEISGYATSGGFCSRDPRKYDYTVYFSASFNKNITDFGGWDKNSRLKKTATFSGDSTAGFLSFGASKGSPLIMKVAISFVSVENARLNLNKEVAKKGLQTVRKETTELWNTGLSKMSVETSDSDMKSQLYTALYHNMLHPNIFDDVNGEYRGFNDSVYVVEEGRHKYVNFSNWDTYRTTAQLQGLGVDILLWTGS